VPRSPQLRSSSQSRAFAGTWPQTRSIPIAINSLISGSLKFRQSVFWRHFLQRRYGPRQVGSLQFEHCRGFVIGQGYGALVTKPLHRATKGARHKRAHHLQS
jgi:hypothetical protein